MLTSPTMCGPAVRRQQAVDQRLQAVGLLDDDLGVFAQRPRARQLQLQQLRRAADAAERVLDLVRQVADQLLVGLRLVEQRAPRGRAAVCCSFSCSSISIALGAVQLVDDHVHLQRLAAGAAPSSAGPGGWSPNSLCGRLRRQARAAARRRGTASQPLALQHLRRDSPSSVLERPDWRTADAAVGVEHGSTADASRSRPASAAGWARRGAFMARRAAARPGRRIADACGSFDASSRFSASTLLSERLDVVLQSADPVEVLLVVAARRRAARARRC